MDRLIDDSLLDGAPCGFVSFADDGTMLGVNRTLAAMLGYVVAELEGSHLQKILPPGARVFYNTHVFPVLRLHGFAEEIYIALRDRHGNDVPMLMNASRRERDGVPVNDCIFVKMLQRHQFEDQLLQARRLAEQAGAAKDKFLSMMSHDVRTPLTTISGHAELLARGFHGLLNEEQLESAHAIQEASRNVERLLDDILSFAQLESGTVIVRLETVPVQEALARAESLIRLRLQQAELTLTTELCEADLAVDADPDRLQQILLNLLTNAIKFTPAGGQLTVSCAVRDDRVAIEVRDNGIGIPPDRLEQIFQPFVQLQAQVATDAPHRGVGLGLAISRELARAMGGEITVESQPGVGSTFTLTLSAA
jgi:PAS domain S-box-containing protein